MRTNLIRVLIAALIAATLLLAALAPYGPPGIN